MGNQLKAIGLLLVVGIFFTHCTGTDSDISEIEFNQGNDTFNSNTESGQRNIQAFENTVYQLTSQHCVSCHTGQTPVHAHPDSKRAMDSLIDNLSVDFDDIPNSRIVAKIKDEKHGCWSNCAENSQEMATMISKWYEVILLNAEGGEGEEVGSGPTKECFEETITTPGSDPVQAYVDVGLHGIFINQCSSCHTSATDRSPFGDSNPTIAFEAAYGDGGGTYLDFANPGQGRMLDQINTGHNGNCNVGNGECATLAQQITSGVTQWALAAQASTRVVETCNYIEEGVVSSAQSIAEGSEATGNVNGGEMLASQATLAGDFVLVGDYLEVPNNGVGPETGDTGNSASFTFDITDPGIYEIVAEVNGPTGSDNSFQVQMDGGNINPFRFPETAGFQMVKVSEGNDDNNDVFSQFTLGAGSHTVAFHLREDGTQLKKIIVQPVGASAGNPAVVLTFDLSTLTGIPNNRLEMDFKILDNYSYEASNVRMINGNGLLVKGLKVYVNGQFSPQHSTFTLIDKTVTTDDELITPYSMVVLKDKDEFQDVIGIKFETISK